MSDPDVSEDLTDDEWRAEYERRRAARTPEQVIADAEEAAKLRAYIDRQAVPFAPLRAWTYGDLAPARANYLWALSLHYSRTQNNWLAVAAYVEAVDAGFAPPAWALVALAPGFRAHLKSPRDGDLERHLGLRGRGSGTTPPLDVYDKVRRLSAAMPDIDRLVAGCGIGKERAAGAVIERDALDYQPDTLAREYTDHWAPFYRQHFGSAAPLTGEKFTALLATFPDPARDRLQRSQRTENISFNPRR